MPRRSTFRVARLVVAAAVTAASLAGGVARAAVEVQDGSVTSFDGTTIAYTLFLPDGATADDPVPVIFMTHGWGGSRTTDPAHATVARLLEQRYAVLTWDQRGFGVSGGEANVDSQEYEVRDVQALITFAAGVEGIATDDEPREETILVEVPCPSPSPSPSPTESPGGGEEDEEPEKCFVEEVVTIPAVDPRMGMIGGSYAGGIQLMTAAADERVDAIVPQIAWHDLPQSLKPGGVLKLGWDLLLYGAGAATGATGGLAAGETGVYNPHIHQSLVEGAALNDWSTGVHDWFAAKSPRHYLDGAVLPGGREVPGISAPALIIQGVSDTLFPLNEGIANYQAIRARGVDAKMIWFCGGHTVETVPILTSSCEPGDEQGAHIDAAIDAWFARYVKGNETVDTGAPIEYQVQDGTWDALDALPGDRVAVAGSGRVTNQGVPTSGQVLAGTPGGCRDKEGTASIDSSPTLWARETARYTATVCPYASSIWVPVGTFTGPPPEQCGEPSQPRCDPTFEFLKPGMRIVGVPRLKVHVLPLLPVPETYLFFKLVDYVRETNSATVIDDQVMAVKVTWASTDEPQIIEVALGGVAWEVEEGHEIYIEISPSSNDHATSRYPNSPTFTVEGSVPVIAPAAS